MENFCLIVDKPKDYTSRDVVNIISKKFKTKKVGHTGTLDPIATGVLVVCINKATKIAELLTSLDKEYVAEFTFGTLTDTLDTEGNVLKEEKTIIDKETIENTLKEMIGTYNQEVPIYSAVKVNGKKLYEYARNNEEVELPKHEVNIKELELLDIKYQNNKTIVKVRCLVSKGTYIRSLGYDIAKKMNTIAIMSDLKRTKQGKFNIKDAYILEDILNDKYKKLTISECLEYPKIEITNNIQKQVLNGAVIDNIYNEEIVLFTLNNKEIGIYKTNENNKLKPWKML